MDLKEFKKIALQNKDFRKEYEKYDLAFEIGQMVIEARILKGITQDQLASLIKTQQPSIARLENAKKLPSLTLLERIAKALGTHLIAPKFAFLEAKTEQTSTSACTVINTTGYSNGYSFTFNNKETTSDSKQIFNLTPA